MASRRETSPHVTVSGTSFPLSRESIFSAPLATGSGGGQAPALRSQIRLSRERGKSIFFAPPATSPGSGQAPALRSQVRLSRESGNPSSLRHLPLALAGDKPPHYGLRYVSRESGESNLFSLIATAPAGDKPPRYRLTLSVIARLPFIHRQAQHERQSRLGTYGKSGSIRTKRTRQER